MAERRPVEPETRVRSPSFTLLDGVVKQVDTPDLKSGAMILAWRFDSSHRHGLVAHQEERNFYTVEAPGSSPGRPTRT